MDADIKIRIEVVERLTKLFRAERMVYLATTVISLIALLWCAFSIISKTKESMTPEVTILFGSSGLITYTGGRLLFMWSEALKRLMPTREEK